MAKPNQPPIPSTDHLANQQDERRGMSAEDLAAAIANFKKKGGTVTECPPATPEFVLKATLARLIGDESNTSKLNGSFRGRKQRTYEQALARLNEQIRKNIPFPRTAAALNQIKAGKPLDRVQLAECYFEIAAHNLTGTDAALLFDVDRSTFSALARYDTPEKQRAYLKGLRKRVDSSPASPE
jgi:hypothetical protein